MIAIDIVACHLDVALMMLSNICSSLVDFSQMSREVVTGIDVKL